MRKTTTCSNGSKNDIARARSSKKFNTDNQTSSKSSMNDKTQAKQQLAATAATPTPKKQHQQKQLRQWKKQHQQLRNMRVPRTRARARAGGATDRPGSSSNWEPALFSFRATSYLHQRAPLHAHLLTRAEAEDAHASQWRTVVLRPCSRSVLMIHRTRSLDVHRPGARQRDREAGELAPQAPCSLNAICHSTCARTSHDAALRPCWAAGACASAGPQTGLACIFIGTQFLQGWRGRWAAKATTNRQSAPFFCFPRSHCQFESWRHAGHTPAASARKPQTSAVPWVPEYP